MTFNSRPELQFEVDRLAAMLTEAPVDEIVTYAAMAAAIGRDVQTVARPSLLRARVIAEKECGSLFATVTKIGVKRLSASSAPMVGVSAVKSIGRKARRAIRRLETVNGNMAPEEHQRISACKSQLGAIALAAALNVEKIEREAVRTNNGGGPLPVGRVFELLSERS